MSQEQHSSSLACSESREMAAATKTPNELAELPRTAGDGGSVVDLRFNGKLNQSGSSDGDTKQTAGVLQVRWINKMFVKH